MQIRELEREIGAELVERRPGDIALTDIGLDVARRAEHILASTRDLVDFARHRDVLSGPLKLGIIPTLAPYILPRVLPLLQTRYPLLRLEVRETLTKQLLDELAERRSRLRHAGAAGGRRRRRDAGAVHRRIPAGGAGRRCCCRRMRKVDMADVDQRRLILLEEGHCLRDQALAFCATKRRDQPAGLGSPRGLAQRR